MPIWPPFLGFGGAMAILAPPWIRQCLSGIPTLFNYDYKAVAAMYNNNVKCREILTALSRLN